MEEVTLGALVILFLGTGIKSVFDYFRQKGLQDTDNRLKKVETAVETIKDKVLDLHKLHDVKDEDGVPVWYVRKSLEELIRQNAEAVTILSQQSVLQTQVLKEIADGQKETLAEIRTFYIQARNHSSN